MKEFAVYTLMRGLLFIAAFLIVIALWGLLADEVPMVWAAVIALLISGVASFFLLNHQREAFARRVEARAAAASESFERQKAHEDED